MLIEFIILIMDLQSQAKGISLAKMEEDRLQWIRKKFTQGRLEFMQEIHKKSQQREEELGKKFHEREKELQEELHEKGVKLYKSYHEEEAKLKGGFSEKGARYSHASGSPYLITRSR